VNISVINSPPESECDLGGSFEHLYLSEAVGGLEGASPLRYSAWSEYRAISALFGIDSSGSFLNL